MQVALNHERPVGYLEPDTVAEATLILPGPRGASLHFGDRDGQAATRRTRQVGLPAHGRLQSQNELSALRRSPPEWTVTERRSELLHQTGVPHSYPWNVHLQPCKIPTCGLRALSAVQLTRC